MEDKERTLYCGNLSDKVTEDLLYELFLQAGPLENVTIPKDKDGNQRNFAFIAFKHAVSVQYAVALMNGISLYGKPLRLDPRSASSEANPYLQQLQKFFVSQRGYQHTDQGYYSPVDCRYPNENRYPNNNRYDSRRYEPRMDLNQINPPVAYPVYADPYLSQQFPPPFVNSFSYPSPGRYNNHKNLHSGYRY